MRSPKSHGATSTEHRVEGGTKARERSVLRTFSSTSNVRVRSGLEAVGPIRTVRYRPISARSFPVSAITVCDGVPFWSGWRMAGRPQTWDAGPPPGAAASDRRLPMRGRLSRRRRRWRRSRKTRCQPGRTVGILGWLTPLLSRRRWDRPGGSSAGAGEVGGDHVAGVTVEVGSGPVVAGGGPGVGVAGRDLDVSQGDAGVEAAVMKLCRRECGEMCLVTPADVATRRTMRVAAGRFMRWPARVNRSGPEVR